MIQLSIIGSGNLAQHLIKAFLKIESNDLELVQVLARNPKSITHLFPIEKIVTEVQSLQTVDLYIIAVSDLAITNLAEDLQHKNKLVVHTSGAVGLNEISSCHNRGVFYPLQTFSKDKEISFKNIPICIEANHEKNLVLLQKLAELVTNSVYKINSDQRKQLHLAAVFVNNFANHLYVVGNEICKEQQLPFDILKPLIAETANKINHLNPVNAQTGPAIRNDFKTIATHQELLKNDNHLKIYQLLTQSIQNQKNEL